MYRHLYINLYLVPIGTGSNLRNCCEKSNYSKWKQDLELPERYTSISIHPSRVFSAGKLTTEVDYLGLICINSNVLVLLFLLLSNYLP